MSTAPRRQSIKTGYFHPQLSGHTVWNVFFGCDILVTSPVSTYVRQVKRLARTRKKEVFKCLVIADTSDANSHFVAVVTTSRVARWYILKPKVPILIYFGRSWTGKICNIYGHLVNLWVFGIFSGIWVLICQFWYLVPKYLATLTTSTTVSEVFLSD
jgi:hypothetical protein